MYATLPSTTFSVRDRRTSARAIPKSTTRTRPPVSTIRLVRDTSRWIRWSGRPLIVWSCAACSPAHAWAISPAAIHGGVGFLLGILAMGIIPGIMTLGGEFKKAPRKYLQRFLKR